MFLHVVMLSLSADADTGFHERVQGYCRRILAECDGVAAYAFRANEASRADGLTHAVVAAFADSAAHDRLGLVRAPGNEGLHGRFHRAAGGVRWGYPWVQNARMSASALAGKG